MEINQKELIEIKSVAIKVIEDSKARFQLAENVLTAFKEHSLEKNAENNLMHKATSKFESAVNIFLEDTNSKEQVLAILEKKVDSISLPNYLENEHGAKIKKEIAKLGLETLMVELKSFNLNQETKALKKINNLKASDLANELLNQAEELRRQVQINRQNHLDVKTALSKNSLDGLNQAAALINPNGIDYNKTKDQEINDFLNGGDLIL